MKRILPFIVAATFAAGSTLLAQSVPVISYDADADFLSLPAYGEVAGVATNSRGHVFVYARTGNPYAEIGGERTFYHGGSRLFEFDQNGTFLKEMGQGTYAMNSAQQVRVDADDNVWIVDAGSNMLMKFNPDGQFLLVMGRKPEAIRVRPGPGVPARAIDPEPPEIPAGGGGGQAGLAPGQGVPGNSFNRPSDVTWDSAGNIYVADGFGSNNRVAKFNPDANFIKSWGQTGSEQGQFNGVRGIASDASDNIYVADAGNNRIQVFDSEGTFKSEITGIGTPQAICISPCPTPISRTTGGLGGRAPVSGPRPRTRSGCRSAARSSYRRGPSRGLVAACSTRAERIPGGVLTPGIRTPTTCGATTSCSPWIGTATRSRSGFSTTPTWPPHGVRGSERSAADRTSC